MTKTLLLGLHNESTSYLYRRGSESSGYAVIEETTLAGVEKHLENGSITAVVMDINLGEPGRMNIAPAQKIHRLVRDTDIRYMSLSGRADVVEAAQREDIPAAHKDDFDPLGEAYREFLN